MTRSLLFPLALILAMALAPTAKAQARGGSRPVLPAQGERPDRPLIAEVAPYDRATALVIDRAERLSSHGIAYLQARQKPDGGWQGENDPPAITAIVLKAMVQDETYDANTPFVKRGYDKLLSYQLEDGGIYKDLLANYNTAIAISSLAAAEDPAYRERIDRAVAYLKKLQWTTTTVGPAGETVADEQNTWYGGWGYGSKGRPDGSNTQLAIEALHDAGLAPDDPAYKAAVRFVTRMQNHSETNDQGWAGDDGGFVYTPARNGESFAGEYKAPDGDRRLRSYGSMTYAGLKSMIYAGLTRDDPRVVAAWGWITSNWTLDENPAMRLGDPEKAQHGLYYYYHTLARALNAYDVPLVVDPQGNAHDWRVELIDKLASLLRDDGSWAGDARWMEDNPVLATSFAVLALQEAIADLREHPVNGP
jgi:squalene-hopene/tetraprenyl-beta-curcumene cyclase